MLVCNDLGKDFFDPQRGLVRAVAGLNLRLGERSDEGVVALVGANGAGKTTLLRMIATLMMPSHGRVVIDGCDTRFQPAAVRRRLGYLSSATRLYPRLTGRELLAYVGGFYGLSGGALDRRIAAMRETFALDEFLDQRVGSLSTGQAQRINLARTLLADPPLLVLDEPTTGLDIRAAAQLVEAVRLVRRPGRLIIFCTHIITEVEALADRLLVLHQGQLAWDGHPSQLGQGVQLAQAIHAMISSDAAAAPVAADDLSADQDLP